MSRGVNKVMILGNCGNDPETTYLQSGTAVTKVSVATSKSWKDKDGNQQEHTEWHRVVFFNRLAEVAGEYLKKGSKVYVEGSLRTNKWQDKDGNDRYTTEIIGSEMQMLGSKESSPVMESIEQKQAQSEQTNTAPMNDNQPDDFEDDIPF